MMQEDQKGCKKNNIRAEGEQTTAARTKQHEDEEEDTGIRAAGREKRREQREKQGKKNKTSKQDNKCHCYRFRAPLIELNENKNYHSL